MGYTVVSIARTMGAGGEEVGQMVAKELGFRYLDNEIVTWAAQKAKVSPQMVAEAETTKPLLLRILESLGRSGVASIEGTYIPPPPMGPDVPDPELYETLIEQVIKEAANEGKAVIVGHGAGIALTDAASALRVFVTASPKVRAERVANSGGSGIKEALKAVEESDKQRREFLRRFYELAEEDAVHYDMVLNTDDLSPATVAALVVAVAKG